MLTHYKPNIDSKNEPLPKTYPYGNQGFYRKGKQTLRTKFQYTEVYSQPHVGKGWLFKRKINILRSRWATGKTNEFDRILIERINSGDLPSFILVLTTRRSLADNFIARFNNNIDEQISEKIKQYGESPTDVQKKYLEDLKALRFVSYLDIKAKNMSSHRRAVICSLQSLYLLRASPFFIACMETFDDGLVLIDEAEDFAKTMSFNETTGRQVVNDLDTLLAFCRNARVGLCDARPEESTATLAYALSQDHPEYVNCIVNLWMPPERKFFVHRYVSELYQNMVLAVLDQCPKLKLVLASTSKKFVDIFTTGFKFSGVNTIAFTSDTGSKEKRKLATDQSVITGEDVEVFAYSPAISIGVDISQKNTFYSVNSIITPKRGCPPRCVAQMLMRIRNPVESSIHGYIEGLDKWVDKSWWHYRQNLLDTSSAEEEDDAVSVSIEYVERYCQNHVKRFHKGSDVSLDPDTLWKLLTPTECTVLYLDAIAKHEMEVMRTKPKESLFRVLRYANIAVLSVDPSFNADIEYNFLRSLTTASKYCNRVSFLQWDDIAISTFMQLFNPEVLHAVALEPLARTYRNQNSLFRVRCEMLGISRGLEERKLFFETNRALSTVVNPVLCNAFLPKKFLVLDAIRSILGLPEMAPSRLLPQKFETTLTAETESRFKTLLEPLFDKNGENASLFARCEVMNHRIPIGDIHPVAFHWTTVALKIFHSLTGTRVVVNQLFFDDDDVVSGSDVAAGDTTDSSEDATGDSESGDDDKNIDEDDRDDDGSDREIEPLPEENGSSEPKNCLCDIKSGESEGSDLLLDDVLDSHPPEIVPVEQNSPACLSVTAIPEKASSLVVWSPKANIAPATRTVIPFPSQEHCWRSSTPPPQPIPRSIKVSFVNTIPRVDFHDIVVFLFCQKLIPTATSDGKILPGKLGGALEKKDDESRFEYIGRATSYLTNWKTFIDRLLIEAFGVDRKAINKKAHDLGIWRISDKYSYLDIVSRCGFIAAANFKKDLDLAKQEYTNMTKKTERENQESLRKCNRFAAQDMVHQHGFDVVRKRLAQVEQEFAEKRQKCDELEQREIAVKQQEKALEQKEISFKQQEIELEYKRQQIKHIEDKLRADHSEWIKETQYLEIGTRFETMRNPPIKAMDRPNVEFPMMVVKPKPPPLTYDQKEKVVDYLELFVPDVNGKHGKVDYKKLAEYLGVSMEIIPILKNFVRSYRGKQHKK
jgi:hypothetical protein